MSAAYKRLHELIHSLNKSEKRYFKLSSATHKGQKNGFEIFDLVSAQEEPDENKLLKKIAGKGYAKNFSVARDELYQSIMKSLRSFHAQNHIPIQARDMLNNIEILFDKGLMGHCEVQVRKIKRIAEKYELHSMYLEVLRTERIMMMGKYYSQSSIKGLEKHLEEETIWLSRMNNSIDYDQLTSRFYYYYVRTTKVRTGKDLEVFDQIMNNDLFKDESKALSLGSKYYYHQTNSLYSRLKGKFEDAYLHDVAVYEMIHGPAHRDYFTKYEEGAASSNYSNLCRACTELGKDAEFQYC